MKILQLCKDMFGGIKIVSKFHHMIANKRLEYKENDQQFCNYLISWLGGRSYNNYLDYSLLAIKMNYMFEHMKGINEDSWFGTKGNDVGDIKELINDLLYDDRHDLYQNMPYILERIYKDMEKGPDKDNFWTNIVNRIIECINVHGTKDASVHFSIEE